MKVKLRQLEGRDHYVAPVVMIANGTWSGSAGAVYYPESALRESVPLWNGKPIVVYHPDMLGHACANRPDVFNRMKVGVLFNTRHEGGKLKADAWLDKARLDSVDIRVANAIRKRQPVEVSTGVGIVSNERTPEGHPIASALQPDHLAILPDVRGACSLADGAGLLVNSRVETVLNTPVWV